MPTTDAAGWRALYEREYPRLVRALNALSGDPDAAEDAAQEAFVRAYRHGLERIERPGAWLFTVGSRELFRSRRRRTAPLPERLTAEEPGFDAATERAELLAALRRLPERQRSMVVARFYYGLSYDEIARTFAVKSGTVGATLHQALKALREWRLAARLAQAAER